MQTRQYEQLSVEEREVIHRRLNVGFSVRAIARTLNPTLSRR